MQSHPTTPRTSSRNNARGLAVSCKQLVGCSRCVLLGGNGFKREDLCRPSTPTPRGTSLSPQAVSQACGKEGEAQEGSSWLQLLRPGVEGHAAQKLFQQERTTTIRSRCSVYQAVKRGKWQLASSCRRCQSHRGSQTYVAGILKVGVVDCPLEDGLSNECRWAVEVLPRATEKRKKGVLFCDGVILKTPQRILWTDF